MLRARVSSHSDTPCVQRMFLLRVPTLQTRVARLTTQAAKAASTRHKGARAADGNMNQMARQAVEAANQERTIWTTTIFSADASHFIACPFHHRQYFIPCRGHKMERPCFGFGAKDIAFLCMTQHIFCSGPPLAGGRSVAGWFWLGFRCALRCTTRIHCSDWPVGSLLASRRTGIPTSFCSKATFRTCCGWRRSEPFCVFLMYGTLLRIPLYTNAARERWR